MVIAGLLTTAAAAAAATAIRLLARYCNCCSSSSAGALTPKVSSIGRLILTHFHLLPPLLHRQREYTIHLHKRTHDIAFKKRAPKGVKEVIKFAQKAMGTKDVRVDPKLNQEIWKLGVKQVPRRIRVRLERECFANSPSKRGRR